MTVELRLLYSNAWTHLTVCKKLGQSHLKMLSKKYVMKSYMRIMVDMPWNQTKPTIQTI